MVKPILSGALAQCEGGGGLGYDQLKETLYGKSERKQTDNVDVKWKKKKKEQ